MPLPTITAFVPNYNHARYLPACLDALLNQTLQPMELIILDDCSTDNSWEILQSYARRHPVIRLHRNERNEGVVAGMNRCLALARGDYMIYAAADDVTLPTLFEKSVNLLARHPQAALSCAIGDWREVGSGLNWHVGVGMAEEPCYLPPARLVELERAGTLFIPSHTALFRRAALLEVGGFLPELKWHSDWFGMYVLAFRHGICFIPEPLGVLNIHASSYYTRGRRDATAYRGVVLRLLELLASPAYADVRGPLRDSGALYLFGAPVLRLIVGRPEFRPFLTALFLRKNLWHLCKLTGKRFLPARAAEWYFRLAGYRARSRQVDGQAKS